MYREAWTEYVARAFLCAIVDSCGRSWSMPWLHYIPIAVDYSDLLDVLGFFAGNPLNGDGAHDDLAEKIAIEGKR